ncbi:MAG TPA: hypothetical protein VE991_04480, partial [Acidimicrobiales bacterium]|nr:hypothetical protein [Acidimicrobiales bacterium]
MSRLEHGPTVLLGGMTGAVPFHGGATWAVLQYALGLERLGCRVVVAETVPRSAFAPVGTPIADSANARYVAAVMAEAGLAERWVLLLEDSCTTAGMAYDEILRFAAEADLVVNLGGALRHQDLLQRVARRLYVDLDPAFTQLWAQCGIDLGLEHHTHFATYGRGLADERSSVPSDGRRWIGTVPPVVRSQWAPGPGPGVAWTTVANWRSYGSLEH